MRNSLNSEHSIDMSRDNVASSSGAGAGAHCEPLPQNMTSYVEEQPSSSAIQVPVSQQPPSTAVSTSGGGGLLRRNGDGSSNNRRHRSPLNSGLWISIELAVTLCQIIASIVVLSLSRNEKPRTPLFAWIVGYASGCVATLPLLYWRYLHRNNQGSNQEARNAGQNNVQHNPPPDSSYISITMPPGQEQEVRMSRVWWWRSATINARLDQVVDHFKMALDCFFAVWFVIGNVWIFGGHSSAADAPNLYRLCIVFLTFSCIGYAMPFILCAAICCCLPCIISILGVREDLGHYKGASVESINALPVYKFKLRRRGSRENVETNSDGTSEGGVLAAGTDKEKIISGEDAECCICLAKYRDNEELRELPCSHCFHVACVDKWLKINASCPLCKAELEDSLSCIHLNRRSNGRMVEDANRGDFNL